MNTQNVIRLIAEKANNSKQSIQQDVLYVKKMGIG